MGVIDTVNIGGADYSIRDTEARNKAQIAFDEATNLFKIERAHRETPPAFYRSNSENREDNTYSEARPQGSIFFWNSGNTNTSNASWYPHGMSMITTIPVTAGTLIKPDVNCMPTAMVDYLGNIKTYVGSDSKLHFIDAWGADTALNFNGGNTGLNRPTNLVFHAMYGGGATFTYIDANPSPVTFKITYLDNVGCQRARFGYLFNPNSQHNYNSLEDFTFITAGTSVTIPANTKCDFCFDCMGQNGGGQAYIGIQWL